jgi:hypothetical protein
MVLCSPSEFLVNFTFDCSLILCKQYIVVHGIVQAVQCSSSNNAKKDIGVNLFDVYMMEQGQTEEGEVSQHLFFCASIEQIDNATMSQF